MKFTGVRPLITMPEKEMFSPKIEKRVITLDDLIDSDRVVPKEYQELIKIAEENPFLARAEFSDDWNDFLRKPDSAPKARDFFQERLKDSVLVDLGGGQFSLMKFLASIFEASAYVNVDKYNLDMREGETDMFFPAKRIGYANSPTRTMRTISVCSDMLSFVSRMKDNSANFALNGIEHIAVASNAYVKESVNETSKAYWEALANELVRATRSKGIIVGLNSQVGYNLMEKVEKLSSQIKNLDPNLFIPDGRGGFCNDPFIFEKGDFGPNQILEGKVIKDGEEDYEQEKPDLNFLKRLREMK